MPWARRSATNSESSLAIVPEELWNPAPVGIPATSIMSLTPTGIPCKGPSHIPRLASVSNFPAAKMDASRSRWVHAFSFVFCKSIWAIESIIKSVQEIRLNLSDFAKATIPKVIIIKPLDQDLADSFKGACMLIFMQKSIFARPDTMKWVCLSFCLFTIRKHSIGKSRADIESQSGDSGSYWLHGFRSNRNFAPPSASRNCCSNKPER